jgi:hypothetical protein
MPTTPPTWRDLGRRARRLGLVMNHGRHEATLLGPASTGSIDCRFISWTRTDGADAIILRTAVAAALEQLETRR